MALELRGSRGPRRVAECALRGFVSASWCKLGRVRKQISVVGAVIVNDGAVLCARRGAAGKLAGFWEFPGGKIEPGESPQAALEREIAEELDCVVDVGDEVVTTTHAYDFGDVTLTTFYCDLVAGTPKLVEHAALTWLTPGELSALEWAPADIPAVEKICADLSA